MKLFTLSNTRRAVQIIAFFLLVYTSIFLTTGIDIEGLPFVSVPKDVVRPEWYAPEKGYTEVFDTYLPIKSCRFIADENRAFRACFMHFANESIVWNSPPEEWIPHLLLFLFAALIFARAWCGWICPLGFISESAFWIRKKLGFKERKIPEKIKQYIPAFKYGFLSFVFLLSLLVILPIGLSAFQGEFSIVNCATCPARTIFPLFAGKFSLDFSFSNPVYFLFSIIGIAFLLVFISSFFFSRPWCRICPSGALLSLLNPVSFLRKEKEKEKCTSCGICERICPMDNTTIQEKKGDSINTGNCIRCFRCVEHCPEEDCLKVKFFGKTIYKSKYKEKTESLLDSTKK